MKNKLVLVIAILVGILAFWLSARYLHNERKKLYEGAVKIKVIAAAGNLTAGTELINEDLGLKSVYKSAVGSNVFLPEDLDKILGKKLKISVKKGSPIMWSQVDMPRIRQLGLADAITYNDSPTERSPDFVAYDENKVQDGNRRAVTVAIAGAAALAGMVRPNDYVDVIAVYTKPSPTNPQITEQIAQTILTRVKVLAIGQKIGTQIQDPNARTTASGMVTFDVETQLAAEKLVFMQQMGTLYLTLRHPANIDVSKPAGRIDIERMENSAF